MSEKEKDLAAVDTTAKDQEEATEEVEMLIIFKKALYIRQGRIYRDRLIRS